MSNPTMTNVQAVGFVAKVVSGVQDFFGNYQSRVKDGLIDRGDQVVFWLGSPKKKNGQPYSEAYIGKAIDHYRRQWVANRSKLK